MIVWLWLCNCVAVIVWLWLCFYVIVIVIVTVYVCLIVVCAAGEWKCDAYSHPAACHPIRSDSSIDNSIRSCQTIAGRRNCFCCWEENKDKKWDYTHSLQLKQFNFYFKSFAWTLSLQHSNTDSLSLQHSHFNTLISTLSLQHSHFNTFTSTLSLRLQHSHCGFNTLTVASTLSFMYLPQKLLQVP